MLLVAARVPGTLFASLGFSPSWMVKILFGSRQLCWRPQAAHHLLLRALEAVAVRASIRQNASWPLTHVNEPSQKKKSVLCARICWTTLRRRVGSLLSLRLQSERRFWLKLPDPDLVPFSNFRSSSNSGFSGIWKHAIPDFTWQYTTCRSEFRTTVQPSGNVTGRTVASELIWLPSCSFPLSPSSLRQVQATVSTEQFVSDSTF